MAVRSPLTFVITGVGGSIATSGFPTCEPTSLKADGRFTTYCRDFFPGTNVQLAGTLQEATLSPIFGLGGATFKLKPGPLKK